MTSKLMSDNMYLGDSKTNQKILSQLSYIENQYGYKKDKSRSKNNKSS